MSSAVRDPIRVDQPEGPGEPGRDGGLDLEQVPVDGLQAVEVAVPAGPVDRPSDGAGEKPALARLFLVARLEPRMKALDHLAIRAFGLEGDIAYIGGDGERALGEERDHVLVQLAKERMKLGGRARGKVVRVMGAGVVEHEARPGLRDPLVAERNHERARARGGRNDAGPEPDALALPVP